MRVIGTRVWALVLCCVMVCPAVVGGQAESDPDLAVGIRQVREGEFEQGLVTLENVANRLTTRKGQEASLARVYTYLAVAYMGLAQKEKAKAKFMEAWKADMGMTLSPKEFPPSVIAAFEQAKSEAEAADRKGERGPTPAPPTAPGPATAAQTGTPPKTTATPAPSPAVTAEKKGGGHTALILGIVGGAAVAAGVAVAAGGGGGSQGNTPPPATTPVASITFLGSSPPPGSTLPATQFALTTSFSVRYSADVPSARVAVRLVAGATECAGTTNPNISLFKDQPVVVQLSIAQPTLWSPCSAPVTTSVVHAYLYSNTTPLTLLGEATFGAGYTFR